MYNKGPIEELDHQYKQVDLFPLCTVAGLSLIVLFPAFDSLETFSRCRLEEKVGDATRKRYHSLRHHLGYQSDSAEVDSVA